MHGMLAIVLIILMPFISYAQVPLSASNNRDLNFGTVVRPTGGQTKIVVKKNSTLGPGTTATMISTQDVASGKVVVSGSTIDAVSISIQECASNGSAGFRLKKFKAKYQNISFTDSKSALPPPGNSGRLKYGATLAIRPGAQVGEINLCYDIMVSYD